MSISNQQESNVVAIAAQGESYSVVPHELVAHVGEEVRFQNLTKANVALLFPEQGLFGHVKLDMTPGQEVVLAVSHEAEPGGYVYTLYSYETKAFSGTSSRPIILVSQALPDSPGTVSYTHLTLPTN